MRQRLFKGDHSDIAASLNNVAFCLNALGRSAEALPKYEAALAMWQRLFKGDNEDVATGLNNVASCLQDLGRPEKALPRFETALAMRRRVLPADHIDIRISEFNLGRILPGLRRYDEAEPLLVTAPAAIVPRPDASTKYKQRVLDALVTLYESRHAAEPGKGYDKKAAEWRGKLAAWQATTQPASQTQRAETAVPHEATTRSTSGGTD